MNEGSLKTPIPKCRLYWSFCLGWWSNFVGSESGQKQSVKLLQNMVYNTTQHPPPPQPHTVCSLYILYIKFGNGEGEVRVKVEGQQYTSIVPSSMGGQQFTSWVENTNYEWMYLQSIKSVKNNATKSINREKPTLRVRCLYSSFVHASDPTDCM